MSKVTILGAAVSLARTRGLMNLTRSEVASEAETSTGLVTYHYGSMDDLRNAVIDYAIQHEVIEILVQARAARHPRLIGKLTPELKTRVANHIVR